MEHPEKKRLLMILAVMTVMLVSLVVYLTYFQLIEAPKIEKSALNRRNSMENMAMKRGNITDRQGQVLATTVGERGNYQRIYTYDYLYSHVIGYANVRFGKSGLELGRNDILANEDGHKTIKALQTLLKKSNSGSDVMLTIDTSLQDLARQSLAGHKGAAVVMRVDTGEVLAMVSLPDFNVNDLDAQWDVISQSSDAPLLNRAPQGLYAPGSTFKLLSAIAYLEKTHNPEETYQCTGTEVVGGYEFQDYGKHAHGEVDLKRAMEVSCNTYFVHMSEKLTKGDLVKVAERVYFNRDLPFDLPVSQGRMDPQAMSDKTAIASSSIGQGQVLATPLQMAMTVAAIANNGTILQPYLVRAVDRPGGEREVTTPRVLGTLGSSEDMAFLQEAMRGVVTRGTGAGAETGVGVAGKTGTAENPSGRSHAWFVGYAPYDQPQVAVAVILEEDGTSGGQAAAPIAGQLLQRALQIQ